MLIISLTAVPKSSTRDQMQWLTAASIVSKQIQGFWLTIKQSNNHSIGLSSYLIYNIFIIKEYYEYHSKKLINRNWSFNNHMQNIDQQSINKPNQHFSLFKFVSNILQQSNCSSTFLQNYHLYKLLIVKWSTFDHIIKISILNKTLYDHFYNICFQLINQLNQPLIIFTFVLNILEWSNYSSIFIQNNCLWNILIIKW